MSSSSFWEQERLSRRQMPTLQDLLLCCSEKRLVSVIMSDYALHKTMGEDASSNQRLIMERRLIGALQTMRCLPIKRKRNRDQVFLPAESYLLQATTGLIERRTGALLASLEDASAAYQAFCLLDEGCFFDESWRTDCAPWPQPLDCSLMNWEDSLASRVWLGGPWCCRERYAVLAGAFWEMTFLGFDCHSVAKEQEKILAKPALNGPVDRGARACSVWSSAAALIDGGCEPPCDSAEQRAFLFGLADPDRFEAERQTRAAQSVALLNRNARVDFWQRLVDLALRIGGA